ncbi:MAG: ABC transporter substrate-binding protein, partial [Chloroflexota bacterium]|nr:ABC transporter substrate-binding protein [Chloroflexota bacterium]
AVIVWATGPATVAINKNFHALGMKMPLMFTITQSDPSFRKATEPASDGDLMQNNKSGLLNFLPDSDPMKKVALDWRKAYQAETGKDPTSPMAAYDPLHLLMNAIHVAGSTDPDKIVNVLETTKWVGINGTYAYSSASHAGLGLDSNVIAVIQKGELVPYKYQCDSCAKVEIPK